MTFKPPSPILQRVARFKAMEHKDGKFFIWNVPGLISQLYSVVYLQRNLEKECGLDKTMNALYSMGFFQAENGVKIINEKFGYAKTISDKKKLIEFNSGQAEMVGSGKMKLVRVDFQNNLFIIKMKSNIALEYKKFFGLQKNSVDHFVRGALSGLISPIIEKETLCIETKCVAMGNPFCEFVSKPLDDWDKNDPLFKSQKVEKIKNMKDLGSKIESPVFLL